MVKGGISGQGEVDGFGEHLGSKIMFGDELYNSSYSYCTAV